jgi:hypothetical protein
MLQHHLKRMLIEFLDEIKKEKWFGKERELISRFVFSKLVNNIGCCENLYDTAQIGIEVRVKQITTNGKKEVCKDLVIWNQPNQTVWSSDKPPLCIMEWKHRNKKPSESDIKWLLKYSEANNSCFGIALNVENEKEYRLNAVLIENGKITDANWI